MKTVYTVTVLRSDQPRPYADTEREYSIKCEHEVLYGTDKGKMEPWIMGGDVEKRIRADEAARATIQDHDCRAHLVPRESYGVETHGLDCGPYEHWRDEWDECTFCGERYTPKDPPPEHTAECRCSDCAATWFCDQHQGPRAQPTVNGLCPPCAASWEVGGKR